VMVLRRLDDICDVIMGQAPSGGAYNNDGIGWPLIAGAGDFGEVFPVAKKYTTEASKLSEPDDIVLGIRASIGDKVLADGVYCLGRGVAGLRPRKELDHRYLWHWLTFARWNLASKAKGATFKQVNRADISELLIPLPPIPEQRRIADILDQADALRAKRRAAVAELEILTESIFLDMFGDPLVNSKGWSESTIAELLDGAEVFVDGDWVESKDQDPEGDIRLIQLADVGDGIFLNKSSRFMNAPTAERLKCTYLKAGDVLIARMPDPLGRACVFPGDPMTSVTVVDVCIVRPRDARPSPVWLTCCLNTAGMRSKVARQATGTTRSRISRGNLARLQIINPPIGLQQEFARRMSGASALKAAHNASALVLDDLFNSLQQRAFRGEL
jgi:type I restriction enzyme S subunit